MKLTEHFTLEELTRTDTGIKNTPLKSEIDNLQVLANGLESIRKVINKPIVISSGFRCKALNRAVGGVDTSAHVLGYAADFTVSGLTNKDICEAIIKAGIKFDQLIDENKNGRQWVHISFDPFMRMEWLIYSNGKYEVHK